MRRPNTGKSSLEADDNPTSDLLRKTTNSEDTSPRGFSGDLGSAWAQDGPSYYLTPCPHIIVTFMLHYLYNSRTRNERYS